VPDTDWTILGEVKTAVEAIGADYANVVIGLDRDFDSPPGGNPNKTWLVWHGTSERDMGVEDFQGPREATVRFDIVHRYVERAPRAGDHIHAGIQRKNAILNALYADPKLNGSADGTRRFTSGRMMVRPVGKDEWQEFAIECEARYVVDDVTAR